ncbi:MAG: hypothetical protein CVV41_02010 [Candidatus Riflebacteria bacterium HGW-Riflebacteria-1]|jgi:hypothetical protein|nr:MAG: hypothetical protein CVV41_02010 [Candidatus Riflebacteria bacterium HGW-Riflebacteria-1]
MKKLFVLFLLVALVPFTVGCSLWGQDEDLDVVDYAKASVSVKVPASVVSASSLRGAVSYTTLSMTIGGFVFTPGTPTGPDADGNYTIVFTSANLTSAQRATLTDGTPVTAVLTSNVSGSPVTMLTFPLTLASTTNVVITITAAGAVTVTGGSAGTVVEGDIDLDAYELNISKVYRKGDGTATALTTTTTGVLEVTTLTPEFVIDFDKAIATTTGVTWGAVVTCVETGASYTLSSTTDSAIFTVVAGAATDLVDVKVVGTTAPKNLEDNKTYKVKLTATNLKMANGGMLTVTNNEYFFKVNLP